MQKEEKVTGAEGNKLGNKNNEEEKQSKIRTADTDKKVNNLIDDLANEDESSGNRTIGPEENDPVLDKYKSEGFDQNSEGSYYNPYTDEYDENYDPHNDSSYDYIKQQEPPEQLPQPVSESDREKEKPKEKTRSYKRMIKNGWSRAIIGNTGASTVKGAMVKHAVNGVKSATGSAMKVTLKSANMAMGAMAGAAAGIATGDPKNVGKNVIAGGKAGLDFGEGLGNRVENAAGKVTGEVGNISEGNERKSRQKACKR